MTAPERCPACRADLVDGEQPAGLRHLDHRRSRARVVPDGTGGRAWECPDCGHHWDHDPAPPGPRRGRPGETRH
ncbi:hypothetical protein [Roseicella aquatilis]|uniref:Uncharacterized protein n=1 Tax=Roseicella aquatilis TaxID=2527868 RepID=A0A4R4DA44_9PROT|nr:hypothetical protein [Roseicella aquatilis]TCZ56711.1 hypothetical protein EXY23_19190 [Roseicella aquatilis]